MKMFVVRWCLVGVSVFRVIWSELLTTSAISCPLWSSVYECQKFCVVYINGRRYVCCSECYVVISPPPILFDLSVRTVLLLFTVIQSVVKSLNIPVVEVAQLTNRFHRILP